MRLYIYSIMYLSALIAKDFCRYKHMSLSDIRKFHLLFTFLSTHSHFSLQLTSLCHLSLPVIVSVNAQHWKIACIPCVYVCMYILRCVLSSLNVYACVFLRHAYAFVHYLDATCDRLSAQATRTIYAYLWKIARSGEKMKICVNLYMCVL